ncbi:hypothetical protein [Vibrio owensii]|uniref:hypothetical protein n=1 Tax=Vibrio owensii TaxID=696485 RepID=UPI00406836E8
MYEYGLFYAYLLFAIVIAMLLTGLSLFIGTGNKLHASFIIISSSGLGWFTHHALSSEIHSSSYYEIHSITKHFPAYEHSEYLQELLNHPPINYWTYIREISRFNQYHNKLLTKELNRTDISYESISENQAKRTNKKSVFSIETDDGSEQILLNEQPLSTNDKQSTVRQ